MLEARRSKGISIFQWESLIKAIQSDLDPHTALNDFKKDCLNISDIMKGQSHMVRGKNQNQIQISESPV